MTALDLGGMQPAWNADFLLVGLLSFFLAGVFLFLSIGRGQLDYRMQVMFGTEPQSLNALRDALYAKALGQAGVIYFLLGSVLLALAFLKPGPAAPTRAWIGAALLVASALATLMTRGHYVNAVLRRRLRAHLRQYPVEFEDNSALARDIGRLFGVPAAPEDTLESYLVKLRRALGISETPARPPARRRW